MTYHVRNDHSSRPSAGSVHESPSGAIPKVDSQQKTNVAIDDVFDRHDTVSDIITSTNNYVMAYSWRRWTGEEICATCHVASRVVRHSSSRLHSCKDDAAFRMKTRKTWLPQNQQAATDWHDICKADYVGKDNRCVRFGQDHISRGRWTSGWNIPTSLYFLKTKSNVNDKTAASVLQSATWWQFDSSERMTTLPFFPLVCMKYVTRFSSSPLLYASLWSASFHSACWRKMMLFHFKVWNLSQSSNMRYFQGTSSLLLLALCTAAAALFCLPLWHLIVCIELQQRSAVVFFVTF